MSGLEKEGVSAHSILLIFSEFSTDAWFLRDLLILESTWACLSMQAVRMFGEHGRDVPICHGWAIFFICGLARFSTKICIQR